MEMNIDFDLNEVELEDRKNLLLQKMDERDLQETQRKAKDALLKKGIAGLDSEIVKIRTELKDAKTKVKCEIAFNHPEDFKKTIIRSDNGERIIEKMTEEEIDKYGQRDMEFAKDKNVDLPENPSDVEEAKILELPPHEPANKELKLFRDSEETEIWAHYSLEELKAAWVDQWQDEAKASLEFDEKEFIEIPTDLLDKVRTNETGEEFTFRKLLSEAEGPGLLWENANA
jgi:hypothetical protein